MVKKLNWIVSTCGGIGLLPLAPGTWAAAVSAIAWFFISSNATMPVLWQTLIVALLIVTGIYCSGKIANQKEKDPSYVVIDEAAGMWITLIFFLPSYQNLITGFILFRFFDIVKPLGIRKMEHLKNGWGIMMDDIVAAIYSKIVLQIIVMLKLW